MAHYLRRGLLMKNLTTKPIVAYSSDGNFIELKPAIWSPEDPKATIYVIDDSLYRLMKIRGVSDAHLTKASSKSVGREGRMVQRLYTYEEDSCRIMPDGEL